MADSSSTPSLGELLTGFVSAAIGQVRVALPGRVEHYDAARQCVSVLPMVPVVYVDPDGVRQVERLPVIEDVPLLFPGSGSYRITWPVAAGSGALLVFSSSSITRWKLSGAEEDPGSERRHSLSDAIAIPGLADLAHPPTSAPSSAMVLHAAELRLGGPDASGAVVVQAALGAFMTALDSAIPSAGTAAQALTALKAALLALNGGLGWRAGTTKTKAE